MVWVGVGRWVGAMGGWVGGRARRDSDGKAGECLLQVHLAGRWVSACAGPGVGSGQLRPKPTPLPPFLGCAQVFIEPQSAGSLQGAMAQIVISALPPAHTN